ncbi:radical SAM protein [Lactococcus lactis]|uniref:radical SAM protein n=1 Tax=Lactococcus lactis TaxID=1358 RepID=UPI00189749C0|nr:radical SAM protein [Lactococcus lactis]
MLNNNESLSFSPKSAAIITMYKCTAKCKDCCFSCSPNEKEILSLTDIKNFIKEISSFSDISSIVWTGGECTLLGDKLIDGLTYAKKLGLSSRIVTNCSWATSKNKVLHFLTRLKNAGLEEINLSTGDSHQEFIKIDKIITVTEISLELGIRVLISVENTKYSKFDIDDLRDSPEYKKIKERDKNGLVTAIPSSWISFGEQSYDYDESAFIEKKNGCNSLYNTIALNPKGDLLSCCGLTVRYMPEMHLGKASLGKVVPLYNQQKNDFLKQWLFTSGPINILKQVKIWDKNIELPRFVHPCQACAYLFQTPEITKIIKDNYHTIIEEITEKFYQKLYFKQAFEQRLEDN